MRNILISILSQEVAMKKHDKEELIDQLAILIRVGEPLEDGEKYRGGCLHAYGDVKFRLENEGYRADTLKWVNIYLEAANKNIHTRKSGSDRITGPDTVTSWLWSNPGLNQEGIAPWRKEKSLTPSVRIATRRQSWVKEEHHEKDYCFYRRQMRRR